MELQHQASATLRVAMELLPQVLGQRDSFTHEQHGTKYKLDLQLDDIELQCDQTNYRLYVSTVPVVRRTELVNVMLRVPEVPGLPNVKIVAAIKRRLKQIDDTVVCGVTADAPEAISIRLNNVSQARQLVEAVTSSYPEITTSFPTETPVTEVRGERTSMGYLPLPSWDRAETLGMFPVQGNRHLFIPHSLLPSRFTPIFHVKDGTWKACLSYLHAGADKLCDRGGKAELVVPANEAQGLLWIEAYRQPVAVGDVLLALGIDRDRLWECLQNALSSSVLTDQFTTRAWQGLAATTVAAQSLLASTEQWASWHSANLLPWLLDEASKARYLLGLVAELGQRVLLGKSPDDGGDLCHRIVRTPGEALLTLAREAGYRFMKAVQSPDLFRLTTLTATTSTAWRAVFYKGNNAFNGTTVAFHQNGTLGKTRDTAHEVPRDLSQIGRLALTSRCTVGHGCTRLGLEVDEVKRRGLHPSELGYMCPSHVNSTADRETGGRTRHLTILCQPTAPVLTNKAIPMLVEQLRTAGERLQQSLPAGQQRLAIVVNSQLAVVLSTAAFADSVVGPRQWLLREAQKDIGMCKLFRQTNPSLTTQSEWGKRLCTDMDMVLMLDLQPGRLRKPQTLTVPGSPTELVWVTPNEVQELGKYMTDAYGQAQILGIVAATEPLLCHAKGTKSIMSVSHRNRSLSVAHATQPIMSTAQGLDLRFAKVPTVTLKTGTTAMVAIMSLGSRHSNEEDQIVISETAANSMLTHNSTHTEWVHLAYDKVPMGGHIRFTSPRNPRLVEGRLMYINDGLPFLNHESVVTVPSAYVIGIVRSDLQGNQIDTSISLQQALGSVSVTSAQVMRIRWCVMTDETNMSRGTHETPGWLQIVKAAQHLLWVELTLVTTPPTKHHVVMAAASDIREGKADKIRIQNPKLEATVDRHIRIKRGDTCHHLDIETGFPPIGTMINNHEYLCGMVLTQGALFTDMSRKLKAPDKSQSWVVTDVRTHGLGTVCITLEANSRPFRTGDKLALRHGQKGIGIVTPAEELPFFPELGGLIPDIVLHPCAVTGRCTIALLIEQYVGFLASLMGCRVVTGPKADLYDFLDASTGKLVQSVTLGQMFEDGRVPSSSSVVSPISGEIIGHGICAPMTVHRLRQGGEVSAQNCVKIGLTSKKDSYTFQPVTHESLRLGTQEADCFNACGSTYLLRQFRSADERSVPVCASCGNYLWRSRTNRCSTCMRTIENEESRKIPHCLLTLRFNLAVGRIRWNPGVSTSRPPPENEEEEAEAGIYPVTYDQALLRLENVTHA